MTSPYSLLLTVSIAVGGLVVAANLLLTGSPSVDDAGASGGGGRSIPPCADALEVVETQVRASVELAIPSDSVEPDDAVERLTPFLDVMSRTVTFDDLADSGFKQQLQTVMSMVQRYDVHGEDLRVALAATEPGDPARCWLILALPYVNDAQVADLGWLTRLATVGLNPRGASEGAQAESLAAIHALHIAGSAQRIGSIAPLQELVGELLSVPSWHRVRAVAAALAIGALDELGSLGEEALGAASMAPETPSGVRQACLCLIARAGGVSGASIVIEAAQRGMAEAIESVAEIRDPAAVPLLVDLVGRAGSGAGFGDDLARSALRAMVQIGDRTACDVVAGYLSPVAGVRGTDRQRDLAIAALAGASDPRALGLLLRLRYEEPHLGEQSVIPAVLEGIQGCAPRPWIGMPESTRSAAWQSLRSCLVRLPLGSEARAKVLWYLAHTSMPDSVALLNEEVATCGNASLAVGIRTRIEELQRVDGGVSGR